MANSDFKEGNLDLESAIQAPEAISVPASLADVSVCPAEELIDDEICLAIKEDEVPDTLLKAILGGLAEEENSLRTLRQKRGKDGKDTSFISLKRGTLLKYMSETVLQKQALSGATGEFDLRGPKFREIFKMFLTIISDTIDEVKIPAEYREMFFHSLQKNLEGWEERADRVIKAMTPKINL
jgi:hypothetical protein